MKISFIGLGSMGSEMARRLLAEGHELSVWNRSRGPISALVAEGAAPLEAVDGAFTAPIVVSMLANDEAALELFTDEALERASAKTLHVNMATLSLEAVRELKRRHHNAGVGYVSAPVLGRPPVAAAGQLNIILAGDPNLVDRAQPVFDALGKKTWLIGEDPIQANLVKIGVNFNFIHAIEALGESIALVEAGGVSGERFVELLTNSVFGGIAYSGYGNAVAARQYYPAGFTVALGLKDLGLVEAASAELGLSLPTVPALRKVFEQTLQDPELQDADWAAIAEMSRGGVRG